MQATPRSRRGKESRLRDSLLQLSKVRSKWGVASRFREHSAPHTREWSVQDVGLLEVKREIKFGNKEMLQVEGVGTVELSCVTPSGEASVTLTEVAYVPGASANLFSIRRATERGASVLFSGATCQIQIDCEVL